MFRDRMAETPGELGWWVWLIARREDGRAVGVCGLGGRPDDEGVVQVLRGDRRGEQAPVLGAVGPMQFLPTTWATCCVGDPSVTRDAIIGAGTYLAQSGGPDDMAAAVYQYNPNDGYVAVVTAWAESLRDEPELYVGYHAFQVFFGSAAGTVRLPIGYSEPAPIDAASYLASNPQDAA